MTEREYAGERSVSELLRDLATGTQTLISKEIQLAKLELRESVQKAGLGMGLLAGAAVMALVGLIMLALVGVYALALVIPAWAAALIVAGLLFIVAIGLGVVGAARLKTIKPRPEETIETLKEDQEWLKQQLS